VKLKVRRDGDEHGPGPLRERAKRRSSPAELLKDEAEVVSEANSILKGENVVLWLPRRRRQNLCCVQHDARPLRARRHGEGPETRTHGDRDPCDDEGEQSRGVRIEEREARSARAAGWRRPSFRSPRTDASRVLRKDKGTPMLGLTRVSQFECEQDKRPW
jgi:hypothetical protein